jgi:hypothetical protein
MRPRLIARTPRIYRVARIAIFSALAISAFCQNPASRAEQPSARWDMPEARLRKLHLVRPDLIPYPIAYEVYC